MEVQLITQNKYWLSVYLYYSQPYEHFLVYGVKPFIRQALKNKDVEGYFFLRYWEDGPHLRLRFKGTKSVLINILKPQLIEHFNRHFEEYPLSSDNDINLRAKNSICFIDYEPEIERYGGDEGILIAERLFEISSKIILDILEENEAWDYERALGTAIQLHLAFVHSTGMSRKDAIAFFNFVFTAWAPHSYKMGENAFAIDSKKNKDSILNAFEKTFNDQKEPLLAFHNSLWNALNANRSFEESWFNEWLRSTNMICADLRKLKEKGNLFETKRKTEIKPQSANANRDLWSIYESYIHMTNNRLGIFNRDEGYLAYLMSKSLDTK